MCQCSHDEAGCSLILGFLIRRGNSPCPSPYLSPLRCACGERSGRRRWTMNIKRAPTDAEEGIQCQMGLWRCGLISSSYIRLSLDSLNYFF